MDIKEIRCGTGQPQIYRRYHARSRTSDVDTDSDAADDVMGGHQREKTGHASYLRLLQQILDE